MKVYAAMTYDVDDRQTVLGIFASLQAAMNAVEGAGTVWHEITTPEHYWLNRKTGAEVVEYEVAQ